MSELVTLERVELLPVLELEPVKFGTSPKAVPSGSSRELPTAWFRYWADALANSSIVDLPPIRHGSWHVPTANFTVRHNLRRFLEVIFQDWGGLDALSDPDSKPVFDGGLALRCATQDLLLELNCCGDLSDAMGSRTAAGYQGADWQMLWIGHPFLSYRYEAPWLILSDLHESSTPCARWRLAPEELLRAAHEALIELERFAEVLAGLLSELGYREEPNRMGRRLAGLCE